MFSPSLISIMWHTLQAQVDAPITERQKASYKNTEDIAARFRFELNALKDRVVIWPTVPVVGYSTSFQAMEVIGPSFLQSGFGNFPRSFWGRVPIDRLVTYFEQRQEVPAEDEFFDVGTTLVDHQHAALPFHLYANQMAQTAQNPKVQVAIIDRGVTPNVIPHTPHDFNSKLKHAVTDVEFDGHALEVLSVILDRLYRHAILPEVEMHCALVKPSKNGQIGLHCFKHANSVELCDAVQALDRSVRGGTLPLAINLSMGTHVGPHNGDSPLEEAIRQFVAAGPNRYFHASAGNDGLSGLAAKRILLANVRDFLKVRVGPPATALLVEFWTEDVPNAAFSIEVRASNTLQKRFLFPDIRINTGQAGPTLTGTTQQVSGTVCQSLFHARCRNSMNCAAFAITAVAGNLPSMDLEFTLEAATDLVVNGWITVCDNPIATFLEGGPEGTISVPASDPAVLSVAGIDANGQPWSRSSRGPTITYQPQSGTTPTVPYLAGPVALGTGAKEGTSYASPRACADTANLLRSQQFASVAALAQAIVKTTRPWNPRTGYGHIV